MYDLSRGTIVVTGGAGLIGSALVCRLNRAGFTDIIIVDRLDDSEKWKHLVPLTFADYIDADDFSELIAGDPRGFGTVGAIFHFGACSATTETDADYLIRNNYEYTKVLAHWAVGAGSRFIYASSAATYGALESDLREDLPLNSLRPLNMYAYSKHLFDLYAKRTGLAETILGLKFFNVFGPNEDHKADMRSIVFKAFEQITMTGAVRLFKSYRPDFRDGEQVRDFLYVKDAADMALFAAQSNVHGLLNIGSGVAHSWLDLVRPIFHALGVPERVEFIDMPLALRGKYQYSTCASMQKLHDAGYAEPQTLLHDAVGDYVKNYLVPGRVLDPSDAARLQPLSAF